MKGMGVQNEACNREGCLKKNLFVRMTVENVLNVSFCFCKNENSKTKRIYFICFLKIKMAIIMGKKRKA